MSEKTLNMLSAIDVVRMISEGKTTAEAVTRACLERIDDREKKVKAWANIDH